MDTSTDSLPAKLEFEWAIRLNRMALDIVGIWPKENEKKSWKTLENLRVYVSLIMVMNFLVIPQMWSLLVVRHDVILVIDNCHTAFPIISSVMKCAMMWWKKEAITEVISEIENDWLKVKTAEEKSTMIKHARLARKITMAGYFMIIMAWIILDILPCFGVSMRYVTNLTDPGAKPLPVQSYYFYDITKRSNFIITFILEAISLLFAGSYYTGVDCFCAFLVLHVCGQMENLSQRLTKLGNLTDFHGDLSFCVKEHVRLIRFVYTFNDAVNLMLLGHLFIFIVLFCFQGFLFIKLIKEDNDIQIFRFTWLIVAMIIALLQMFIFCFVGEILVMCCEELYEAAYKNEWYTLEPHEAKMLVLILIGTQPPLYVTAGKMFPLNMAIFCNVIKTSVSYISVMLACS